MPEGAREWVRLEYAERHRTWHQHTEALKRADDPKRRFMQGWLVERARAFAIETGQIEGLYTLRRGVTEQLVAEGFGSAVSGHTYEGVDDKTLQGLLRDQKSAYDMVFDDIASGRPLSAHMVKTWHQLLTRHQETVVGIDPNGRHVAIPFETKGRWKIIPNNPRRQDGVLHEYCPPEHTAAEMDRFFDIYNKEVGPAGYPVHVEAAWLHHRFVRTHPFQDGNGRTSRLLMAWPYMKEGLPPPIISAVKKPGYLRALESADKGDLKFFADHSAIEAESSLAEAIGLAEDILSGELNRPNGNGGRTVGDEYIPPPPKIPSVDP